MVLVEVSETARLEMNNAYMYLHRWLNRDEMSRTKSRKELRQEVATLRSRLEYDGKAKYNIAQEGDPTHEHSFDDWELTSESGIAFCIWRCSCGLEVAQLLGERLSPTLLPKEQTRFKEWCE